MRLSIMIQMQKKKRNGVNLEYLVQILRVLVYLLLEELEELDVPQY